MQTTPTQQHYMDEHKARLKAWGMMAKPDPVVIPEDLPRPVKRPLRLPPEPYNGHPKQNQFNKRRGEFTAKGYEILDTFIAASGWSLDDLQSKRLGGGLAMARNRLMYLLSTGSEMSNSVIGRKLNRKKDCVWRGVQQHRQILDNGEV